MTSSNTTLITPDRPVVLRPRFLTNPAAEFVETGAGQAIIARVVDVSEDSDQDPPEFDVELDRFVSKAEVQEYEAFFFHLIQCLTTHSENEYYKLSSEKIAQFEGTLKSLCSIIKKRKLDVKAGIKIKEPKDYKMEDVFVIAGKIFAEHNDPGTNNCMGIIRKCFRVAGKHENTLTSLLNFVPTDIYGSILCGGFTLILVVSVVHCMHRSHRLNNKQAVKNHENLLKDIQTSLSDIPRKLDTVRRLKDAYKHQTGALNSCADQVFLSIFIVLERIIDRLSMNFGGAYNHYRQW